MPKKNSWFTSKSKSSTQYSLFLVEASKLNENLENAAPIERIGKLGRAYKRAWELQLLHISDLRLRRLCYQSRFMYSSFFEQYMMLQKYISQNEILKNVSRVLVKELTERRLVSNENNINLTAYYGTHRKRGRPPKVSFESLPRPKFDAESTDESEEDSPYGDRQSRIMRRRKMPNFHLKVRTEPKFTPLEDLPKYTSLYLYVPY